MKCSLVKKAMRINDQQKLLKASPGQETLIDTIYDAS